MRVLAHSLICTHSDAYGGRQKVEKKIWILIATVHVRQMLFMKEIIYVYLMLEKSILNYDLEAGWLDQGK